MFIGDKYPTFIVAEISGNHAGEINNALKLIEVAAEAGANAVKFQAYTANSITFKSEQSDFIIPRDSPWASYKTLFNLYSKAETPFEWIPELFAKAEQINIPIFASVFDLKSIELLENYKPFAYKIASAEAADVTLLKRVSETKKPIFISNGLLNASEMLKSHNYLKNLGVEDVVWLKAISAYPGPVEETNLKTLNHFKKLVNGPVGLSDHSTGIEIPIAAVALGANVIEKHIKLANSILSVDDFFSLNPSEFNEMTFAIRNVEKALGTIDYNVSPSSQKNLQGRRSLYCVRNIEIGEVFTEENVKSIRPSLSLSTEYYEIIMGKKSNTNLNAGDRITLSDIKF